MMELRNKSWISVADKLPDYGICCLVVGNCKDCGEQDVGIGYFTGKEWISNEVYNVTHWIYAPAPPQKGFKDGWTRSALEQPEEEDCLVFGENKSSGGPDMGIGDYQDGEWYSDDIGSITHWVYIPDLPEWEE